MGTASITRVTFPLAGLDPVRIRPAEPDDAGEILTVQRAAFLAEGQRYENPAIEPLVEPFEAVADAIADPHTVVLVAELPRPRGPRLVGAGRLVLGAAASLAMAQVTRVAVAPDRQGRGIGGRLLGALHARVEAVGADGEARPGVAGFELVTGAASEANLRFYAAHGYQVVGSTDDGEGVPLAVLRRPVLPDPPGRPRARVACFVLLAGRLLVFEHADVPAAGTQVPAGGIEAGESVAAAAMREVAEETGVSARFEAVLGYVDGTHPGTGTPERTACVRLSVPGLDATAIGRPWPHRVGGEGVDAGMTFRCRWARRPVALIEGQAEQSKLLEVASS